MSQENVDTIRELHAAFNRSDHEAALSMLAEDVEWHAPGAVALGAEVNRDRDAVQREFTRWLGAWESYRFEITEITDLGDQVYLAGNQMVRGRGSGVEVTVPTFHLFTLRDGRVSRMSAFESREAALEAAGRTD